MSGLWLEGQEINEGTLPTLWRLSVTLLCLGRCISSTPSYGRECQTAPTYYSHYLLCAPTLSVPSPFESARPSETIFGQRFPPPQKKNISPFRAYYVVFDIGLV
jgi:hypothetical protein